MPGPARRRRSGCRGLRSRCGASAARRISPAPLCGNSAFDPGVTPPDVAPPDRTVLPRDTAFPDGARTGSASDVGPMICSSPGPITAACDGQMVVTAGAIPMAAPKIRVLIYTLMVRGSLTLSPLGADAPLLAACLHPRGQAWRCIQRAL